MIANPRSASGRIVVAGNFAGTAWRIRPGLAISAAHCLRVDPLRNDYHTSCDIEFPEFRDSERIVATVNAASDVDPELDIALLRLPNDVPNAPSLKAASLPWDDIASKQVRWSGYGYPLAEPTGMELGGQISGVLEIHVKGIQLRCDEGGLGNLRHASGTAVVVRGRTIGVIYRGPEALGQKVIFARPMDQIERRFPELRVRPHPEFHYPPREDKRYLRCDRDPQTKGFLDCFRSTTLRLFLLRGPEHEAPEYFIERVSNPDHLAATSRDQDWQIREVRWPWDIPASTQTDFVAALSRAVLDDEVPFLELAEAMIELSREAKLVIVHRMLNLSRSFVQGRFDEVRAYYARTLPALFEPRLDMLQQSKGIVFVQPCYWERDRFAWFSRGAGLAADWMRQLRQHPPRPLDVVMAPELRRITAEHVADFLTRELPHLSAQQRAVYLREIRRRKTSREVLKFLAEEM